MPRKMGRFTACKPPHHFSAASLQKIIQSSMVVSENKKGGRYDEADIENTRRSHRRGAYAARLDLLWSAILFRFHTRPCRNDSRHPRCVGSDYRSDYEWNYSAGNGISISPYGIPMAAAWLIGKLQDANYALRDFITG